MVMARVLFPILALVIQVGKETLLAQLIPVTVLTTAMVMDHALELMFVFANLVGKEIPLVQLIPVKMSVIVMAMVHAVVLICVTVLQLTLVHNVKFRSVMEETQLMQKFAVEMVTVHHLTLVFAKESGLVQIVKLQHVLVLVLWI